VNDQKKLQGIIVTYVLVFGGIALMFLAALFGYLIIQFRLAEQKNAWNEALNIAEAGIDHYRWCLNNGIEAACAGQMDYRDGSGAISGKFLITAVQSDMCGQTINRTVTSTGWTNDFSSVKRSVRVLYARKSIAAYSGIINEGVWFGNDEALAGPFMANGGIRMDGPHNALVSSAALFTESGVVTPEWICDSTYGCSPCPTANGCRISSGQCVCPGVFTTTGNSNPGLFQFPVVPFDFNSITINLADIKSKANTAGIYLPKSNILNANGKGYHLKFQSDGTVKVYIITALSQTERFNDCSSSHCYDRFTITAESIYGTYAIPAACSVIYAEDSVWPEGTVNGKVALASANLIAADNIDTDIILSNSINYAGAADGLLAIAEKSVYIGPQSPDTLELHGVYVAQKGKFYRNYYSGNIRANFLLYGSYISKERPNETWVNGSGTVVSGYRNTSLYYDPRLIYDPPAFMPYLSPDYKIVSWREID
jgi:hypothetical protein